MKPRKPNHFNQERNQRLEPRKLHQKQSLPSQSKTTSWGGVSNWYDEYLKDEDNYQHKVIVPNLLRLLDLQNEKTTLLDLGCGQGFFIEKILEITRLVHIEGVDLADSLLKIGKEKFANNTNVNLTHTDASNLSHIKDKSIDLAYSVLALQNMENLDKVIAEVQRVMKKGGRCVFVINHPAFRIPKESDWHFSNTLNKQGRVVYTYMSDKKYVIDMNPGQTAMGQKTEKTVSFHHPLQYFSKVFNKNGFAISKIEEWISHKKSEDGARKRAEDDGRKEIPMFMCFELISIAK